MKGCRRSTTSLPVSAASGSASKGQVSGASAARKSTGRRGRSTPATLARSQDTAISPRSRQETSPTTTYSARDSLARLFQLLASGEDLRTPEANSFLKSLGLRGKSSLAISSLKTLRDYSTTKGAVHSQSCSLRFMKSGMLSNGSLSMADISFRKAGSECSFSDILEANPSARYFLSETMVAWLEKSKKHQLLGA